ncbi:D-aminoacyl-tRNA deacylase [Aestuariispira insulae]|uniref:D-aminoacyl-tRNA deacylase n=1 Tax=Aestuariispira insulae TaxID=1461337 RepID=A0A3D9HVF7_9PROT|nr:D-aminoacyl-tRNA deacylase [Aestuariispira insulae]RED53504.1 D-tyrosyl-tRNA(Tyr) deacylase [Aestuariispira insulae]
MKIVLQRVAEASVTVEGETTGAIGAGLLILVCGEPDDSDQEVSYLAGKIAKMRIFEDDQGKMNRSIQDIGGSALVVSQFTLAGEWRKGNRPGFSKAAPPEKGEQLYEALCAELSRLGLPVEKGRFGADMKVQLLNDGPVTIVMDTARS